MSFMAVVSFVVVEEAREKISAVDPEMFGRDVQPQRLRKWPPQGAPNKAEPLERRSPLRQMKNSVS